METPIEGGQCPSDDHLWDWALQCPARLTSFTSMINALKPEIKHRKCTFCTFLADFHDLLWRCFGNCFVSNDPKETNDYRLCSYSRDSLPPLWPLFPSKEWRIVAVEGVLVINDAAVVLLLYQIKNSNQNNPIVVRRHSGKSNHSVRAAFQSAQNSWRLNQRRSESHYPGSTPISC